MSGGAGQDTPAGRLDWMSHPLFLTFVVFLPTSVRGSFINQSIQRNAEARAAYSAGLDPVEAAWRTDTAEANEDITLMFERAAMTDLLRSPLHRRMTPEVRDRKFLYDAIYQRWNTQLPRIIAALDRFDARDGAQSGLSASFMGDFASKFGRIAECIYDRRPSLWSRIVMSEAEQNEVDLEIVENCEATA